jgi:hypothetical protein
LNGLSAVARANRWSEASGSALTRDAAEPEALEADDGYFLFHGWARP